jgi:hypothetical protein
MIYRLTFLTTIMLILAGSSIAGSTWGDENRPGPIPAATPIERPPFSAYKGVTIGTKADDARTKLGEPKDKSNEQDSYIFAGGESAQIYYDAAKTVTAITITFSGKLDAAPTAMSVFGENAEVKPDGGVFKMVRYPKAGYWISYNKIPGSDAVILIALQKM